MKQKIHIIGIMSGLIFLLWISYMPHHHHDGMPCYEFKCFHSIISDNSITFHHESHESHDHEESLCCHEFIYLVETSLAISESETLESFRKHLSMELSLAISELQLYLSARNKENLNWITLPLTTLILKTIKTAGFSAPPSHIL